LTGNQLHSGKLLADRGHGDVSSKIDRFYFNLAFDRRLNPLQQQTCASCHLFSRVGLAIEVPRGEIAGTNGQKSG
jgi:hypothetical protein